MRAWLVLFGLVTLGGAVDAGSDDALRRALVGRRVMIPFDMPVNYLGVDFDGDHALRRDDDKRLERIELWGASIRGGDIAMISDVRVSQREIHILLGRGGLTTTRLLQERNPNFRMGDDIASATDPESHSMALDLRSNDLREEQDAAGTPSGRRAVRARHLRAIADTLGAAAEWRRVEASRAVRVNVGSRLRILFENEVSPSLLEPTALMLALSEHIMFVREAGDVPEAPAEGDTARGD